MNQVPLTYAKHLLLIFLVFVLTSNSKGVFAQTFENPWAIGLGGGAIRYSAHPGAEPLQFQSYHPSVAFVVARYMSSGFNFRVRGTIAPKTQFPLSIEQTETSYLYDMSYQLIMKLNNGVILKESSPVGAYGVLGIGGSFAPGHPDAYFPLGGGLSFRMGPNIALRLETVKKISLNREFQNLEHAVAFIYNLPSAQQPVPEEPGMLESDLMAQILLPADSDLDGLVDANDACPDVPGMVKFQGCPTAEAQPNEEWDTPVPVEVVTVQTEPSAMEEASEMLDSELAVTEPEPEPVITELSAPVAIKTPKTETKGIPPAASQTVKPGQENLICANAKAAITAVGPVKFRVGSDELSAEATQNLDAIAQILQTCPQARLVLNGYTDDTGSSEENLVLSIMRAYKVKYYLVYTHGISQQRIVSDGLGEANPLANNSTTNGRRQNRRVDFTLIY